MGVVYNVVIGTRLALYTSSPFALLFGAANPLTWTMDLLIGVALLAGSLLLPCVAYCRITRAHKRSAGILLIVGGVILTAVAIVTFAAAIGGVLFLAAGALALISRP